MDLVNAVGNAASGAAAALGTGLKDAIGVQEPEDTGEAFARRGHVAMQAHFDESLQRWVFPGEDPMAPTAEEQREMRAAALPPPPKNLGEVSTHQELAGAAAMAPGAGGADPIAALMGASAHGASPRRLSDGPVSPPAMGLGVPPAATGPAQMPAQAPAQMPAQMPGTVPGQVPAQAPAQIAVQAPAQVPAQ